MTEDQIYERIESGHYNPDKYIDYHNRDAYRKKQNELYNEFKHDLQEVFGVLDNPKADKCFKIAWSNGHDSGFHEVYLEFSELVELIKD